MIEAKPSVESVAEALSAAVPTLDPAEQRLALQLYRMLLAGKPVTTADLAARAGMQARLVEAALGRWPGVFRDREDRIVGFWGLAIRGMPHRFATEAGEITTWCALDPLRPVAPRRLAEVTGAHQPDVDATLELLAEQGRIDRDGAGWVLGSAGSPRSTS